MRARRGIASAVLVALLASGGAACSGTDDAAQARAAAQKFLDAWSSGNYDAASAATDAADGPRQWLPTVDEQLGGAKVRFALDDGSVHGDSAAQAFTASWALPGQGQRWSYPSKLSLVRKGDAWTVHWDVTLVHPDLTADRRFKVERTLPERAAILDSAGQPLFTKVPVTVLGVEPRKVPDIAASAAKLVADLAPVAALNAADIVADAKKAKPDAFVEVVSLRAADFAKVKAVAELPGVVTRTDQKLLTATRTFGQPLLGKVGEATAEVLKETGPTFAAHDVLGLSGLQRAFNKQLAGEPVMKISLIDSAAKPVKQLAQFPGRPGDPLKTTLDRAVQTAAETALADVGQLASIVAIKPSTGELLAVANSPSANFDVALEGKYPPGSTFKIITATAALQAGTVKAGGTVACPGTVAVGGRTFVNANKFDLGTVPLRTAFAKSCNTSFIGLGGQLPDGALTQAAAQYGFGAGWKLPVRTFDGSVPPATSPEGKASDAIGQGTVLASPFSMAMVAASLQRGSLPTPSLIANQPASARTTATPLSTAALDPLRQFARAVVTEGTAKAALGKVPGELAGKTGTAEYGAETPPRAHSWFVGYRGDLAFAVFVYDGASTNLPGTAVTATFLKALG